MSKIQSKNYQVQNPNPKIIRYPGGQTNCLSPGAQTKHNKHAHTHSALDTVGRTTVTLIMGRGNKLRGAVKNKQTIYLQTLSK